MRWVSVCVPALLALALVSAVAVVRADAEEEAVVDAAAAVAVEAAESDAFMELSAATETDAEVDAAAAAELAKDKHNGKGKHKKHHKKHKRVYVGGSVDFNRAMNVRGVMAAGSVIANNATVKGTLIARQLKTKHVKAHTMSVGELKTTRLSSPTGTIVVEGDLLITHSRKLEFRGPHHKNGTHHKKHHKGKKHSAKSGLKAAAKKAAKGLSFLAEEVVVGGVKQWALVRHDHFQSDADGWTLASSGEAVATHTCGAAPVSDYFLGGHCNVADGPVQKTFAHLPPHTQLRVSARYHFIDNWRGETAFARVDSAVVWTQSHRLTAVGMQAGAPAVGLQLCGSAEFPETRLSSPIDVSIPHTASSVTVAFGAHSASSASSRSLQDEQSNACQRSFGVDDVEIWVR